MRLPRFVVTGGAVLSLLVVGAILGITADRLLHRPAPHVAAELHHEQAMGALRQELGLTDAQVAEIDSVFRIHQRAIEETWSTFRPSVTSAIDSVHAHIESILRPEQTQLFRTWLRHQTRASEPPSRLLHEPDRHDGRP